MKTNNRRDSWNYWKIDDSFNAAFEKEKTKKNMKTGKTTQQIGATRTAIDAKTAEKETTQSLSMVVVRHVVLSQRHSPRAKIQRSYRTDCGAKSQADPSPSENFPMRRECGDVAAPSNYLYGGLQSRLADVFSFGVPCI